MQPWRLTELGRGSVSCGAAEICLALPPASAAAYHDAQISDYASGRDFRNAPPLRLSLRARAQGNLRGTAGFGFWNHAFVPGQRGFRLPQALWFFFASPPSDIAMAKDVPGRGWKAATFNARNWRFYALLPLALPGFLLMRQRQIHAALWPIGQRALGVQEAWLDCALLRDFHQYSIDWRADEVRFAVDGETVLRAANTIGQPLGFIAWIDNQYAVVKPQGRFDWGLLELEQRQALYLRDLQITR